MLTANLNLVLLPLDIKPFDTNANMAEVTRSISRLPAETDLVVLPEMFNTGFTTDKDTLRRIAEAPDGNMIHSLEDLASKYDIGIWGTTISSDDNDIFVNRGFMIGPSAQKTIFYDKRHTFSYGGESEAFSRGSAQAPIVSFRGWKLKMSICYDIRFPVWNRSRANEYDALIVPANWVHSRYYPWRQLLIARAIENQAYVAGCNREGEDSYGSYNRGDSLAFDFAGREIGEQLPDGALKATFDAAALDCARKRFAPWRDADSFTIDL